MKFEVINDKNKTMMSTTSPECIYDKSTLTSMSKAGYKFKIDGKIVMIKKISKIIEEMNNDENN